MTPSQSLPSPAPEHPVWWKMPMLWLVIGGPLSVVIASLVTAFIAAHGADPVLTAEERGGVTERQAVPDALTPALQARNHAATAKP